MTEVREILGGKYQLLELLGSGGSGHVYLARQHPLERMVALKLLRRSLGEDPVIRRRFAREARAVAQLNHPNITTVYDFGVAENDILYLAMELIDGRSLQKLLASGMPTIPALLLFEQVLSGLAHAHARGLVHRDLKPANVLITKVDDQLMVKIVDFGIASVKGAIDDFDGTNDTVIGTPAYMSPEQAQGFRNLGPATDLYNVGVMLYEAAAGQHPFRARTPEAMMLAHVNATVPRPLARPGFLLPTALERIILKLLSKSPERRYTSAADVRAALREVRESLEDRGHAVFLPVAPAFNDDAEGRITLVEGAPRVVSTGVDVSQSLEAAFVGRQTERGFLMGVHQRVVEQQRGAIVILEGEAGIGKTRLATWLSEQVIEDGSMRGFAGRNLRDGSEGLRGLREVVEQLFGTRGMETAEASARVASQLISWKITDARDAGFLIEMIRPPEYPNTDGRRFTALPPHSYDSLFSAVVRAFRATAQQKPLLVLLDDFQWAGTETADFLRFLAGELNSHPFALLVIVTLRPEELITTPQLTNAISRLAVYERDVVFRVRLERMSAPDAQTLIRQVLPAHTSLVRSLTQRSQGNPLYLLQILRYLVSEKLLKRNEDGTFDAAPDVRVEDIVPPNLADLLLLRLDQAQHRYGKEIPLVPILERAAILGSRFPYRALEVMIEADPGLGGVDLERSVDILLDEGLLQQASGQLEDLLDFNHGLVRDVLLKRLAPRRSTRRLHVLAAEAKKSYFANRLEVVAGQLSVHYELGHDCDKAALFARLSAETAERMHRPADAVGSWRRYLRLRRFARDDDGPNDAVIQIRVGELEASVGLHEQAEGSFRAVMPPEGEVLQSTEQVRAALGLAQIGLQRGHADGAEALFQLADHAARRLANDGLSARATLGLGHVSWHRGHTSRAVEQGRLALEQARLAEVEGTAADALWFLGDLARLTGNPERASNRFREALSIFEALERPEGVGRCQYGLALVSRNGGDLDRAEMLFRKSYNTLEPLGVRRGLGHCLNGLGEVARFRGQLDRAREFYQRAFEVYESSGLATDAAVSLTNLGLVARDAGDMAQSREAMERALRVAEATHYEYLTLGIAFNLAWVYARLGERDACQALLDEHLTKAIRLGVVDPDFAQPLEGIAEVLDAEGDVREARRLYERAREMWEELRRDRDASRVSALIR